MSLSPQHFAEVTNGYEKTTSGLWTHKGNLNVSGSVIADSWHNVVFQNGFANYGGSWGPTQYTRTATGMVRFRGLMVTPANTTWSNTVAFSLPPGYALALEPGNTSGYHHFACMASTGPSAPYGDGGVIINANGSFQPWQDSSRGNAASTWFDLTGFSYMAV